MSSGPQQEMIVRHEREIVTAIIVDGGFYRRRAKALFGEKGPEERAAELTAYCARHIARSRASLYRIFYYDCPPSTRVVYHPLTQQQVNLGKSDQFAWMTDFLAAMARQRKVALRRGDELETQQGYTLKPDAVKRLFNGSRSLSDMTERDFDLDITQKGVDMRIGLDIAALAERRSVNQIVMISGDSDFVPAAKHARRSGIDFILDPMWAPISDKLHEHVDDVRQCVKPRPDNELDPLHANNASTASQHDSPKS